MKQSSDQPEKKVRINNTYLVFRYLSEPGLTNEERLVGVIAICKADIWRGFVAKRTQIDKIAELAGLRSGEVIKALSGMHDHGWLEWIGTGTGDVGGYRIPESRLEQTAQHLAEYRAKVKAAAKERALAEKAKEAVV